MDRRNFLGSMGAGTAAAVWLGEREVAALPHEKRLFEIYDSESFEMDSKNVGDRFLIGVSWPASYSEGDKSYPLVYVLDANIMFGTATEILRLLQVDLIEPGVRDLTPEGSLSDQLVGGLKAGPNYDGHGSAANFLRFVEDELHPRIAKEYRVNDEGIGIFGDSFGRLFTAYAFQQRSPLFDRYWMGSPGLLPGAQILDGMPAAIEKGFERDARVFISLGELEETGRVAIYNDLAKSTRRLIEIFDQHPTDNLTVSSDIYPSDTHITALPPAITDAFRRLYMG